MKYITHLTIVSSDGRRYVRLWQEDVPDLDGVFRFRNEPFDARLQTTLDVADHVQESRVVNLKKIILTRPELVLGLRTDLNQKHTRNVYTRSKLIESRSAVGRGQK